MAASRSSCAAKNSPASCAPSRLRYRWSPEALCFHSRTVRRRSRPPPLRGQRDPMPGPGPGGYPLGDMSEPKGAGRPEGAADLARDDEDPGPGFGFARDGSSSSRQDGSSRARTPGCATASKASSGTAVSARPSARGASATRPACPRWCASRPASASTAGCARPTSGSCSTATSARSRSTTRFLDAPRGRARALLPGARVRARAATCATFLHRTGQRLAGGDGPPRDRRPPRGAAASSTAASCCTAT